MLSVPEVQSALAANAIGVPVAIRLNIISHVGSPIAIAAAVDFGAMVFLGRPVRLSCQTESESGYTAALVEFSGGQTASMNVICMPNDGAAIECLVIGNKRTLQLDLNDFDINAAKQDCAVINAVERACRTGDTIELRDPC